MNTLKASSKCHRKKDSKIINLQQIRITKQDFHFLLAYIKDIQMLKADPNSVKAYSEKRVALSSSCLSSRQGGADQRKTRFPVLCGKHRIHNILPNLYPSQQFKVTAKTRNPLLHRLPRPSSRADQICLQCYLYGWHGGPEMPRLIHVFTWIPGKGGRNCRLYSDVWWSGSTSAQMYYPSASPRWSRCGLGLAHPRHTCFVYSHHINPVLNKYHVFKLS